MAASDRRQIFNRMVEGISPGCTLNHVVEDSFEMDAVFRGLAHPVRREMIARLAESDLTVGELAEPLSMSLAGASKHVKALEQAGIVRRRIHGRSHVCSLEAASLGSASALLNFYRRRWEDRLDALEDPLQPSASNDQHDR